MRAIESVSEAIEIVDFMLDEIVREARYVIREHDKIALVAKRDAIAEVRNRLHTGTRNPRWHLAQPYPTLL